MEEEKRDELEEKQEEMKEKYDKKEKVIEDISERKSKHNDFSSKSNSRKDGNLLETVRGNPWIVATFVLGAIVLIGLFSNFGLTGNVSKEKAGDLILDFANKQGVEADLVEVNKVENFYEVILSMQGQEIPLYVTKDGKSFVQGLVSLEETSSSSQNQPTQTQEPSSSNPTFTEEQNLLIQEFSSCLYDKNMRVYYAEWCGYCHDLIETFGGLENAGNMMIECQTADGQDGDGADLCEEENIQGFPTIKINGEQYSGARTFDAFAEATGCVAPQF